MLRPMTPWWKTAVVYQIYPRSFADTDGDGVGDLEGIRRHLDHLAWLGVDAIWLSPFFRSPMADFGYDVSDYCDVDPLFGTLDDFDRAGRRRPRARPQGGRRLGPEPHLRPAPVVRRRPGRAATTPSATGTSGATPRPTAARPTTGSRSFERPAGVDPRRGDRPVLPAPASCPSSPTSTGRNPEVVAAMHDTLRFWLDRGVDGFRMDVVHLIGKDPDAARRPARARRRSPTCRSTTGPRPTSCLRGIRALLDGYPGDRMIGRRGVPARHRRGGRPTTATATSCTSRFNFPPLYAPWDAPTVARARSTDAERELEPDRRLADLGAVEPRQPPPPHPLRRPRPGPGPPRCCCSRLRGTPFLYAGEELGLEDAVVPPTGSSTPAAATAAGPRSRGTPRPTHGWGTDDPWLPWPPDADTRNVEAQRADPDVDPAPLPPAARRPAGVARAAARRRSTLLDAARRRARLRAPRRRRPRALVLVNFTDAAVDVAAVAGDRRRLVVEVSTAPRARGRAVRRHARARRGRRPATRRRLSRPVVDLPLPC